MKDIESRKQLSISFTVVIQHLSNRLIKPNFCVDLPHRRSTTFFLETRNSISWHSCQKNACADRTGTAFMIHFFTALFQTTQVDLSRLVLAMSFITAVRKAISWHSCQSYSVYVESILSKQHVWLGDTLFYCFTLREALAKIPGVMNLVGRNLVVNSGL